MRYGRRPSPATRQPLPNPFSTRRRGERSRVSPFQLPLLHSVKAAFIKKKYEQRLFCRDDDSSGAEVLQQHFLHFVLADDIFNVFRCLVAGASPNTYSKAANGCSALHLCAAGGQRLERRREKPKLLAIWVF
jgi:hypothetical protein